MVNSIDTHVMNQLPRFLKQSWCPGSSGLSPGWTIPEKHISSVANRRDSPLESTLYPNGRKKKMMEGEEVEKGVGEEEEKETTRT